MTDSKKISLLYVDDEEVNLMVFKLNFNEIYNVYTASSAKKGLEILEDNHTDIPIVISDMRMPIMDGIEFIEAAKNKYNHINYFILTGFDVNDEIGRALNENLIQGYFRKPFDVDEIIEMVNKHVN